LSQNRPVPWQASERCGCIFNAARPSIFVIGGAALYRLKSNPARMLITILIGNKVVNIAASAVATVLATRWFGHLGPGIAVGALTVLILNFGETTPKSLATRCAGGSGAPVLAHPPLR
jgi:CBS domain containing-hemolysin-like protein